jgi:hypothetical protein
LAVTAAIAGVLIGCSIEGLRARSKLGTLNFPMSTRVKLLMDLVIRAISPFNIVGSYRLRDGVKL